MKKILPLLAVILGLLVSLVFAPSAYAAVIFSDTFSGGYNHFLWTLSPDQTEPTITEFGIKSSKTDQYTSLKYSNTLPRDIIIKFDIKINSSPASDVGIFVKNSSINKWKNVYLFGIGNGGRPDSVIIRDSEIWGNPDLYAWGPWTTSTGIHHIEIHISGNANTLTTLADNGSQILSRSSSLDIDFNELTFDIYGTNSEFANFQVCDTEGCPSEPTPTSSPTPSPTPSSTPTPTPTHTPTPTPVAVRKVVVAPGLGGSWNRDALVNCKIDNYEGGWTSWTKSEEIYEPLLTALSTSGWQAIPFYYDWRRKVTDTAPRLQNFIASTATTDETVHLVAHSLGGLVGRAYLESVEENHRLDRFLSVGSPHAGTALSYPAWSAGEIWGDVNWRIATTFVKTMCLLRHGWSGRETVERAIPVVQNLLPTADYLKDWRTGVFKPVSSMHAQNNWLPTLFGPPFYGVTVGTLSGNEKQTLSSIRVKPPTRRDVRMGNWLDGRPTSRDLNANGDGTVLLESSQLPGADNRVLAFSHTGLVSNPQGIAEILDFLGTTQTTGLSVTRESPKQHDSAILIVADSGSLRIEDAETKRTYNDSDGQITILSPKKGQYRFSFYPRRWTNSVYIFQFLADGRTLWRQYRHRSWLPKFGTLTVDLDRAVDDILR